MMMILEGLEGVLCHMNDIVLCDLTEEEYSRLLKAALRRLADGGLTLQNTSLERPL